MIEFFRDVLNGPLYIVVSIIAIILIMAIIGFIMERKKLEKEHNEEIAHISNPQTETVTPIEPINIQESNMIDSLNVPLEQQVINIISPEIETVTQINPTEEIKNEQVVVNIDELVQSQEQA